MGQPKIVRVCYRLALVFGVCLLSLAGASYVISRPRSSFSEEKVQMIRIGMSEADIVSALGKPAGNYSSGELTASPLEGETNELRLRSFYGAEVLRTAGSPENVEQWVDDWDSIWIWFDVDKKVLRIRHMRVRRIPDGLAMTIRRWLGF